jgi:hypothetical protein
MKKSLMLCGLLLALTASMASAAAGVNLRWTDCFADAGLTNKTFACTSNAGQSTMVGSFELGADLLQSSGIEVVLDVATAGATLPAWWQFKNAGACRQTALSMSTAYNNLPASTTCLDWSNGSAAGGVAAYQLASAGANTARVIGGLAESAPLSDFTAGQEYYAFTCAITNVKTVGTGACAGCSTPACIVFNSIKCATNPVAGEPSRDVVVSGPTNGTDSNFVTWQGGAGVSSSRGNGCPLATPTHNTTWSSVKSMYR